MCRGSIGLGVLGVRERGDWGVSKVWMGLEVLEGFGMFRGEQSVGGRVFGGGGLGCFGGVGCLEV